MKELILKKITLSKRLILGVFITCVTLMWVGLFILLYYTSIDGNSYLNLSLLLILFICILFSALGIYIFKFFKAYMATVNQLSEKESSLFVDRGTSRPFVEKWLPSFIIYQDKVKFFKILKQPEYTFADIKSIHFKRFNLTRSQQDCRITIQLVNGRKDHYNVHGNLAQRIYLKDEAVACNPKIIIDDTYA